MDPNQKYTTKYLDMPNTPLYPFGYGLSYTTFEYSKPSLSKSTFKPNEKINISVNIKNIGTYDGEEVVQIYIRDLVSSATRPVKELKGFKKIMLKKGENKTVIFELTSNDLAFYNDKMEWVTEPGEFNIFVGGSSETSNVVKIQLTK